MGNENTVKAVITIEDIRRMRRRIKIGDTVKYPMTTYDLDNPDWRRSTKPVKAMVIAKYPHLVQVIPMGRELPLQTKTMTYIEIAMTQNKCSRTKKGRP